MKRLTFKHFFGCLCYTLAGFLICSIVVIPKFTEQVMEIKDRETIQTYNSGCNQGLIKGVNFNPVEFKKQADFCAKMSHEYLKNYKEISQKIEEYSK